MECTFAVVVVAVDRRDRMGSRRHLIIVIICWCTYVGEGVYMICSIFIAILFVPNESKLSATPARDMDIAINL